MSRQNFRQFAILVVALVFFVAGCGVIPGIDPLATPVRTGPLASSLLPNLPGYSIIQAQTIQDFIVSLGETGSVLTGQFQAAATIGVVDRVIDCYQDIGAVAAAGYSKDALPIVAGVVAVSNRDLLTDPRTFLACVGLAQQPQALGEGQGGGGLQPCGYSYSMDIQGQTYDFLYAGTDLEICQVFCSALPGCTGN